VPTYSGSATLCARSFDDASSVAKRSIDPLVKGRVRLRLLEETDLPLTLDWRNRDENRHWFFSPAVISPDQHRGWFDRYRERDDDFVFVIEETDEFKRPVGQLSLYDIDWATGRAEFGRLLIGDPEARGLGVAQLATALLVDEALEGWGLREIHLECRSTNARAIAVYAACGFHAQEPVGDVTSMVRRRAEPGG
jgi:RimJ/RimL family protein N-acetyltransferase